MAIRGFLETVLWRVAPLAFLVLAGGWYLGQSTAWRVVQNQASEQLAHHGEMLTVRLRRRLETATRDVVHLATELQMSEHVLLDHCEVLFAEDLVEPADDGAMLAIVQARSVM